LLVVIESFSLSPEIFQYACQNHYAKPEMETPMVFLDSKFWHSQGVYQVVETTAQGRAYHDWLLCTDSVTHVVQHFLKFAKERNVSLLTEEELQKPFWVTREAMHLYLKNAESELKKSDPVSISKKFLRLTCPRRKRKRCPSSTTIRKRVAREDGTK
tara:strand:- start:113 stop:583 length:471 start_codon:yes stop_codon:yes gene_type:complete